MSETQTVETPQLDRGNSHRITSRFKIPAFWKNATSFVGADNLGNASEQNVSEMLKQFNDLKTLDASTRDALYPEVKTYLRQLATLHVLIRGGQNISRWLLLFLLVLIWISAFRVTQLVLNVNYSIQDPITAVLLFCMVILAYSVLMGVFMLPSILNVNSAKVLFVWHFTVSLIYVIWLSSRVLFPLGHGSSNLISYSIVVALTGNIEYEIAYFFLITVFIVFGRIAVERWYTVRYPLAILICNLIDVLSSVEQKRSRGIDLKEKLKQLSGLEITARCIEWYLPQQLYGGDVVTDTWWKEIMREVANALRDKKRWILSPKEDTQDWLTRSLASTLVCIIKGNWDGLERMKDNDVTHPHLWRSRVFLVVGLFIEAALPILAFLIIQHFFSLSTPVHDYLIVGLFLWVLITVIGSLDPSFSDKVAAIKNVTSIISPPK